METGSATTSTSPWSTAVSRWPASCPTGRHTTRSTAATLPAY